MDTDIIVETPESVKISYEVAGAGSRFIAQTIDLILLFAGYLLLLAGFSAITKLTKNLLPDNFANPWFIAILIIVLFIYFWGYFIFFESVWSGQTPGKRIMKLRVIHDGGYPVNFSGVVLRNFLRIADWLPACYMLGLLLIMVNKQGKRLGDYVAGTLVIKERGALQKTMATDTKPDTTSTLLPVEMLNDEDILLIKKFLLRRKELDSNHRSDLALRISGTIMKKMGAETIPPDFLSVEDFLEKTLEACGNKRR